MALSCIKYGLAYRYNQQAYSFYYSLLSSLSPDMTFQRLSNATMFDSAGKLVYAPANMVLNSTTLATQSVTVTSGAHYTLSFKGTGSVAISNAVTDNLAGTGAEVRVSKSLAAASTTTLTLTVTGTVTEAQLERTSYNSPLPYMTTGASAYYGPRFDYNPSTLTSNGLLYEPQSTNYIKYSNTGASGWGQSGAAYAQNIDSSPDGANSAASETEDSNNVRHEIFGNAILTTVVSTVYTFSAYLKKHGSRYGAQLMFPLSSFNAQSYANFNLDTGQIGTVGSSATASMQAVGNGWYRCSITASSTAVTATTASIVMTDGTSNFARGGAYQGDGASYILVWGVQYEISSTPTSLVQTYGAAATRLADALSFTIPNGVTTLRYVFDDVSTQDVAVTAGAYTVPTTLDRSHIKSVFSVG